MSHSLAGWTVAALIPQRAATCECGESKGEKKEKTRTPRKRAAAQGADKSEINETLRSRGGAGSVKHGDWKEDEEEEDEEEEEEEEGV